MSSIDTPVVQSARLRHDVAEWFEPEDVAVVPLALTTILPKRDYPSTPAQLPHVLFVSNLMYSKGPLAFVDVAKQVLAKEPSTRFTLAGARADEATYLGIRDAALSMPELTLIGPRYDHDLYELFRAADIFVFPSFYKAEAFPLVILHAMEASLPVVATDVGSVSDIVLNGVTGWVVPPGDVLSLSARTLELVRDATARMRFGSMGRERLCVDYALTRFRDNWDATLTPYRGATG
jgi:glycosyltransferase involved in cell wall biosynthesis